MWRRLLAVLALALVFPAGARAADVLVLEPGGGAALRDDPFLAASPPPPAASAPARRGPSASAARARRSTRRRGGRRAAVTVSSTLAGLARRGLLSGSAEASYLEQWNAALAVEHRLSGTRLAELSSVTITMHDLAVAGEMTPSRLAELFLTLERNVQWWTSGPLLSAGDRVEFPGSGIVWEYYPGQGLQLQVLGTFGRADGLYTAGPAYYPAMRALVDEMIPLAAQRDGQLAWEYLFSFDGGTPPWVSAMAQATGIEALTRAAKAARAQGDAAGATRYLAVAQSALGLFSLAPPAGVAVATSRGERYLLYSFAPGAAVINAFLQTLIGLYDYAAVSGNAAAKALFAAGNAEAQAELPAYDTGAWSLYQPGQEDDLSYHQLVTGFLAGMCSRTGAPVYCTTARHFQSYLTTPPALALMTRRVLAGRSWQAVFELSKYSHVGIVVLEGSRTVFSTSAIFGYGHDVFAVPALPSPGSYTVHLAATDLAGNFSRIAVGLQVLAPPRPPARPHRHRGSARGR